MQKKMPSYKKTPNPLVPIAQALGQDVGRMTQLLEENNATLTEIRQLLKAKQPTQPAPANSTPATDGKIVLQPLTGESGSPLVAHYRVQPPDDEEVFNYALPIPEDFMDKRGWLFCRINGQWELLINYNELAEPMMVEGNEACEVFIIAGKQVKELETIIATETNL